MNVANVLSDYTTKLTSLFPDTLEGIYLTGSAALDDYYSKKSDIDFITVLKETPGKNSIEQLKIIHKNIEKTHHYPKLNGYYITTYGIKNKHQSYPSFFKNKMYPERDFELAHLSVFELTNYSLRISGTPVEELQLETDLNDVIKELHENINSYWKKWIRVNSAFGFNNALLTLFPRLTEWGILGVTRQLYTLETGKITSKLNAGIYYLDKVPLRFRNIIQTAVETRPENKTQIQISFKRAQETLKSMDFIISEFNRIYQERVAPGIK